MKPTQSLEGQTTLGSDWQFAVDRLPYVSPSGSAAKIQGEAHPDSVYDVIVPVMPVGNTQFQRLGPESRSARAAGVVLAIDGGAANVAERARARNIESDV